MPSIEVVCISQASPISLGNLPFDIEAEVELISHRECSIFQLDFDHLTGRIYHLGISYSNGTFFASQLLIQWYDGLVKFRAEYIPTVRQMFTSLINASPEGKILFTSDYQFGGEPKRYKRPICISKFWELHEADKIRPNALYRLIKG